MKKAKIKILSNYSLKKPYHKLSAYSDYISKLAKPGQFVHIKCSDNNTPLLRRPFSIYSVSKEKGTFEILYEVLGEGTKLLSQKKRENFLDIIGPIGSGFSYNVPFANSHLPILVAGGIGVAPLVFLAERLAKSKIPACQGKAAGRKNQKSKILVLIGTKTKSLILCKHEFKKLGCDVKIATEDGSLGFRGIVTDLLRKELITHNSSLITGIYSCGPRPMLQEVSKIAKQHKIKCQVSLEELIACGVGVCLGCAVNTKSGYKLVCKDGPVFNSDEIIWG
jgi:dihydroorotate dehydrogenase electron transfer subunit